MFCFYPTFYFLISTQDTEQYLLALYTLQFITVLSFRSFLLPVQHVLNARRYPWRTVCEHSLFGDGRHNFKFTDWNIVTMTLSVHTHQQRTEQKRPSPCNPKHPLTASMEFLGQYMSFCYRSWRRTIHPWHWLKNCLEQRVERFFRFYKQYICEICRARKRETTQCNSAKSHSTTAPNSATKAE